MHQPSPPILRAERDRRSFTLVLAKTSCYPLTYGTCRPRYPSRAQVNSLVMAILVDALPVHEPGPNFEIRNKFKLRIPKSKTATGHVSDIGISDFGFRVCFGFRDSDFGFATVNPLTRKRLGGG
jgi:hypothetical protein